jgi:hypothetical protein
MTNPLTARAGLEKESALAGRGSASWACVREREKESCEYQFPVSDEDHHATMRWISYPSNVACV